MARVCSVGGTRVAPLGEGWQVAAAPAGKLQDPTAADLEALDWFDASVPCTAASALRAARQWSLEEIVDFDAKDWFWRRRFEGGNARAVRVLRFGGLATLADVWLNGTLILRSENMFVEHEVDVGRVLLDENLLIVCCRALNPALAVRRPRARWRTRLAPNQLRWFRTSLHGRIAAWSPPAAPVGPWRPIVFEERGALTAVRANVRARLEGNDGVVDVEVKFGPIDGWMPHGAIVHVGNVSQSLTCRAGDRHPEMIAQGSLRVAGAEPWWPHTHGVAVRHPVSVEILGADGETRIDLGHTGFRTLSRRDADDGFGIRINHTDVFCRGACWTPIDSVALTGGDTTYREALEAVRSAGMNMLRVCGPFFYEADAFYDACDELGILVWQDYPFANMDYPGDDEGFCATVDREVRGFLDRTQLACSVAVLCGNSEVEQQAAMMGAPRELWRSPLFSRRLADLSKELRPDVPYWPSTPSGGALPFFSDAGTAHYFGVGAYLRPLEDARRADVRFATECLAFANVPDEHAVDALMEGHGTPPQDPRWKRRSPRDGGVGWDFDDVRDHYLGTLFGVDALATRYADVPRYLALSRVVTGEVMASTFAEWRRTGSRCNGALVWFLRDLWLGAGWGVLDSEGYPKAAYHYLKRALQPIAVFLIDEGLNGLDAHIVNERAEPLDAELHVELFRGEHRVAKACAPIDARPRTSQKIRVAAMFDQFHDTTYSYRFGPPAHDLTVATLLDRARSVVVSEAFHFPRGLPKEQDFDLGLQATATPAAEGSWRVSLHTRRFAQSVFLDVKGFAALDNYVHVPPGATREVILRPLGAAMRPQGSARALNATAATKLTVRD